MNFQRCISTVRYIDRIPNLLAIGPEHRIVSIRDQANEIGLLQMDTALVGT